MLLSLLTSKRPRYARPPTCRVITATSVPSSTCRFRHAPSLQVFPSRLRSVRLRWGPARARQSHSLGPGKIYSGSTGWDGCKIRMVVVFTSEVVSPIFWLKSPLSEEWCLFTHSWSTVSLSCPWTWGHCTTELSITPGSGLVIHWQANLLRANLHWRPFTIR